MDEREIQQLMVLRAAVGLLGEQADPCWWRSMFCADHSEEFLVYIVPRTVLTAQVLGVASAAAVVHDENEIFRPKKPGRNARGHVLQCHNIAEVTR